MLLTTHSMEEAESLCQRIAIFAGGRVQCVGEPQVSAAPLLRIGLRILQHLVEAITGLFRYSQLGDEL